MTHSIKLHKRQRIIYIPTSPKEFQYNITFFRYIDLSKVELTKTSIYLLTL
jgi:hypothetical protein